MQLNQSCAKFVSGYFSTNDRAEKTKAAYRSDLTQFSEFASLAKAFFLSRSAGH
jgi:hypothetical protein